MRIENEQWELTLLNSGMPTKVLDSLAAGDIDGDGRIELVTGGDGLFWYRPDTNEFGKISDYYNHVGVALHDIDGDGLLEVITGESACESASDYRLAWYKPQMDLNLPWSRHIIDGSFDGHAHDIVVADIDGDGEYEIVTISCYSANPGIFIFKKGASPELPWEKFTVVSKIFTEGLSIGDINGDGRMEIVCGPDWYEMCGETVNLKKWKRHTYAKGFREMCRTLLVDITGNGSLDIVILESEYTEGRLSWFENRISEDPANPLIEHRILSDMVFAHSLEKNIEADAINIMIAEMDQGGWNADFNYSARVMTFSVCNKGKDWTQRVIYQGEGTHQALFLDIDGDNELEVVGKTMGYYHDNPRIQIWKKIQGKTLDECYEHQFVDRDKPFTGIDIISCDINGDGLDDIVCGCWWYRNPGWERFDIPGVIQVINAYDIDGDGRKELIAILPPKEATSNFYDDLNSELCWLKAIDPEKGLWQQHYIGCGSGDWPHGSLIAPLLPGGRLGLVIGFHSAFCNETDYPEIFEIPEDPTLGPWTKRILAKIQYGEEFSVCDITGNGLPDIIAGPYWLENLGNGEFRPYRYAPENFYPARQCIMDVNGNGRPDIILGQEVADWEKRKVPWSPLAWFENPEDPRSVPWNMHVIDSVKCAHSIGVGDLDGDGELELICGEHDPFSPYRSRCRTLIYKKADMQGISWKRYTIDNRFEHHDGTKIMELSPGRKAIISHGWKDSIYVNLWEYKG